MKKKKIIIGVVVMIIILCVCLGAYGVIWCLNHKGGDFKEICSGIVGYVKGDKGLIDDWKYSASSHAYEDAAMSLTSGSANAVMESSSMSMSKSDATLGFAVGGAKGIDNFRENIKNGYFPISTDITYNGLFYNYYFNTGKSEPSEELFTPSYSTAYSKDPISNIGEYYMTVGLNSNIKESDFQRKKLNVVVVMDISGSMSSKFNKYYYDNPYQNSEKDNENKSKMQIANESLNLLIDELKPEDRLGIVLFDNESYLAKPVSLIEKTDIGKIKEHILEIKPQGGTNFDAGYTSGTELFTEEMLNNSEYENRIIVITDAMPNLGTTSRGTLTEKVKKNAENKIYTTFIGVGVDFNTEVIECLSSVTGANYFSVHNSDEFKKIMGEDFDYMVTPLVFDLQLQLKSGMFEISQVYGTDCKDKTSGTVMKVNTLFPSRSNSSGETKGGVILLKLKPLMQLHAEDVLQNNETKLIVSYKDRNGKEHINEQTVELKATNEDYYDNTGIRKAIVLTRYANLMKEWILFERSNKDDFVITEETGIKDCVYGKEDIYRILGENERTSVKLSVSEKYVDIMSKFKEYMKKEITELGDTDMNQEIEILNLLTK